MIRVPLICHCFEPFSSPSPFSFSTLYQLKKKENNLNCVKETMLSANGEQTLSPYDTGPVYTCYDHVIYI